MQASKYGVFVVPVRVFRINRTHQGFTIFACWAPQRCQALLTAERPESHSRCEKVRIADEASVSQRLR